MTADGGCLITQKKQLCKNVVFMSKRCSREFFQKRRFQQKYFACGLVSLNKESSLTFYKIAQNAYAFYFLSSHTVCNKMRFT